MGTASQTYSETLGVNSGTGDNAFLLESTDSGVNMILKDSATTIPNTIGRVGNNLWLLKSGGNVGIGTASPNEKLEVSGSMILTNDNDEIFLGSAQDSSITYDGTDMVFDSQKVGSGDFVFNNGDIGVGTATPDGKLHLYNGNSGATANGAGDEFILESSGSSGMSFLAGTISENAILFGDSGDNDIGQILYDHDGDLLKIRVGGQYMINAKNTGVGIGANTTPLYKLSVSSTDASDQIGIFHDNSNAYMKWTDGDLWFQTDEGTNSNTILKIAGKGTGYGAGRYYAGDDTTYLNVGASGTTPFFSGAGTATELAIQSGADIPIKFFQYASEGETEEVYIYGYKTGDARRSLQIGVGVDADDTASFDGVNNYLFDGNVEANGNFTSNGNTGLNGNFSTGNCWMAYSGGIMYSTNCTSL